MEPIEELGPEEKFAISLAGSANFNRFSLDGTLIETILCGRIV
jgi:hypothetical protein